MNNIRFALTGFAALASMGCAVLVAGCGSGGGSSTAAVVSTGSLPSLETLRSAPVSTTASSVTLTLSAQLYRSLQPGTSNSTLSGTVTITPAAGAKIPAGFTITAAYAVEGTTDGAFTITTPIVPTTSTVSSVQATIADGPGFAAGSGANIVVAFTDNLGNKYLLQTPSSVTVGAVY